MSNKKFRLIDVILSVICVVFVAEAAAPVASIGNSQFFWWILMIIAFLLPYGLISSELGTAYSGDGGIYDWVSTAYPKTKWGARVSWYYFINFPLWMASSGFGWRPSRGYSCFFKAIDHRAVVLKCTIHNSAGRKARCF